MFTVYATIRFGSVENAPHDLSEPDEGQRDEDEEHAGDRLQGHHKPREISGAILGAEENLLRRSLAAHVDHDVAVLCEHVEHDAGEGHAGEQDRDDGIDQIPPARRRQAADRDAEKRREQHDVGEEREEHHRAAEPANAGQFQEQDEEADQEQVTGAPEGFVGHGRGARIISAHLERSAGKARRAYLAERFA
jgi:hypothetical protein